jgi:precorrin-6Y C5,15-methyltransferase (decarboxylating)
MSDELNPAPLADLTEAAPPATRTAPTRSPRKKKSATPPAEAPAAASDADATDAKPKPRRAPRKPRASKAEAPSGEVTADLFALTEGSLEAASEVVAEVAPERALPTTEPAVQAFAEPAPAPQRESEPLAALVVAGGRRPASPTWSLTMPRTPKVKARPAPGASASAVAARVAPTGRLPTASRSRCQAWPTAWPGSPKPYPSPRQGAMSSRRSTPTRTAAVDTTPEEPAATPEPLPPLTVVSLGLELPPVLSAAALETLRGARVILGTADALDRLAGLGLEAPQQLCAADSAHMDVRAAGHAGSVLVVVGDGAGDGPALELLADLGPAYVRVLPGVGRVQAACAALGLSAEVVTVVDLRRAPLAALRGRLRAHCLFALPLADAAAPVAVARLLLDSGFAGARVWVCEFAGGRLQARAWLASELVDLREAFDTHAVLILATGPSSGVFAELPGLSDAAFGDEAGTALPLAARVLAMAWLQPAAWESGWAISEGEASLALEWARAVPTARVRAVGVEPTLLGVSMARAGVGDNLSAIPAASPQRCREWPMPEAVFIRGAAGLPEWLAAAWERLAPGGRLVATAEDDQARADLLAFAGQVPATAWQELSLSRGETVAGRLRFAPSAPVRLALWCKPALS